MVAKEIRFAVGSRDDVRSSIWRLWANRDDVFLAMRAGAQHFKISFHKSGICRAAQPSKTPRPAISRWKRPAPTVHGFTNLFVILVPPTLSAAPFHDVFEEKKPIFFVPPPDDTTHKVIFRVAIAPPRYREKDFLDVPRDRPMFVVDRVALKSGNAWLWYYHDQFREHEKKVIREYTEGITLHHKPGDRGPKSFYVHMFETKGPQPRVTDVRMGRENVAFDRRK